MNAVPAIHGWSLLAWRGLAWLCCVLMLVGPGLPPPSVLGQPPVLASTETESEESVPVQDDDDAECGQVPSPSAASRLRQRQRERAAVVSRSWLVHLPHHHGSQSGYSLPLCTPFERGNNLPLRC